MKTSAPHKSAIKPQPAAPRQSSAMAADPTAAFLREVDEAMQAEKWQNLWSRWRWHMLAGVAAALLAAAAWQGWQAWDAHQQRAVAAQWDELQLEADAAKAKAALPAFIAQSDSGYQALGLMAEATLATTPAEKLKAYQTLAASANPDWLRAFGQFNAALILLQTNPAEGKAQLELLAKTEVGTTPLPTVPLALEQLALEAMRANDTATAKGYTERLLKLPELGGTLTPALRQRALQRLGALGGAA